MPRKRAKNSPLPAVGRRPRGRPVVHGEAWTKVTVILFDRQLLHLHRLAADARARTGTVLNRTEIIRALVDAMLRSGFDITTSVSESDLRKRLLQKFSA